jgi:LacI family transcriptional regulator
MALNIKQIAGKCGFSVATVSQVLNNAGKISPETRQHVLAICDRLGYRPRLSAKTMRTGRFGTFTLLISNRKHVSNFPLPLFDGINEALSRRGLLLNVVRMDVEELTDENFVPKFLREWSSDGLLVNQVNMPVRVMELIRKYRIPAVWLNAKEDHDSIYPDDLSGGRMAVEHLIALGHQRIDYADFSHNHAEPVHYSVHERWNGYAKAMQKANLRPRAFGALSSIPRHQRLSLCRETLAAKDRPTAVVAYGSSAAHPILLAALMDRRKLHVPRDLSLVVFQGDDQSGLQFSSVSFDPFDMGIKAVEMLVRKVESRRKLDSIAVPYSVETGETSGPLPD